MMVKSVGGEMEHMTLLDSGATRCLRQARSESERESAQQVNVKTAIGDCFVRRINGDGALLVKDDVQPINPLGLMAQHGLRITWGRDECCAHRPQWGKIPVCTSSTIVQMSMDSWKLLRRNR